MAGIICLLARDVLERPGGQAREAGLVSEDNRCITDSEAGGDRIKQCLRQVSLAVTQRTDWGRRSYGQGKETRRLELVIQA